MDWILNNKEWIFSGIGVAVIVAIVGLVFGKQKNKQIQKSGNNSINIQVGGDVKKKG